MEPLYPYGCRHDILGHYLKASGLLRVLTLCADETNRDPDTDAGRAAYFAALEAADRRDFHTIANIWRDRLAHAETPDA